MPVAPPFLTSALNTFNLEIEALIQLRNIINNDNNFTQACKTLLECKGRVIVIGMGKSGHIASKIAATFASTGTPAFFVHPAEAGHGDFGMITKDDIVVAISNSGSTEELNSLIPLIKKQQIPLIAITSKPHSTLGQSADTTLNLHIDKEACPLNLAPTSSTTATLVLGDALAIALLEAKNFTAEDFAISHPSGSLGKRLLLNVANIMKSKESLPTVAPDATLQETILEITSKGLGVCFITDHKNKLLGVFTDGDLRRVFQNKDFSTSTHIQTLMRTHPKTINKNSKAITALETMNQYKITSLAVTTTENELIGIIHMHDLVKEGIA